MSNPLEKSHPTLWKAVSKLPTLQKRAELLDNEIQECTVDIVFWQQEFQAWHQEKQEMHVKFEEIIDNVAAAEKSEAKRRIYEIIAEGRSSGLSTSQLDSGGDAAFKFIEKRLKEDELDD